MHSATIIFALAVAASASAGGLGGVAIEGDSYARPAYTSSYAVADASTGDKKSASETRDGDVTKGTYSVVQPDGIVRTVNYIVTPLGGFQAQVLNNGVLVNPAVGVAPVAVAPAPAIAIARPALALGGPVLGLAPQPVLDTPAVAAARIVHAAAHKAATVNHLAALAAAASRPVLAGPVGPFAGGPGHLGVGALGGLGWGR